MNAVIRAARMTAEPLLLQSKPRPSPRAPVSAAAAAAVTKPEAPPLAPAAMAPPLAPVVPSPSEAARLFEQDRLLRESMVAERQRVLQSAHEEGHQAGVEQGRAEYAQSLEELQQLLDSVRGALAEGINGTEEMMVEIAFEAVGKMLGDALATREGARAAVREAMRGVREREHLVVRVSPRDQELLAGENLSPSNIDAPTIDLVADERVELGGCLIETGGGTLDGRLETQMQRLRETLVGVARMSLAETGAAGAGTARVAPAAADAHAPHAHSARIGRKVAH